MVGEKVCEIFTLKASLALTREAKLQELVGFQSIFSEVLKAPSLANVIWCVHV